MAYKKLAEIQKKLKVPKGNYNEYGKYRYRSCEDICEAVKPILADMGAALVLQDELVHIGDRYYIKATARIVFADGGMVESTAYAREEETKKGMDAAQITGSVSSYARKYALNGLLCIDDTKDPDTMDNRQKKNTKTTDVVSTPEDVNNWLNAHKVDVSAFLGYYRLNSIEEMTPDRYQHMNSNRNLAMELGGIA